MRRRGLMWRSAARAGRRCGLIRRAAGDRADEIPEMVVATSLFANYHVTLVTLLTGHLPDRTSALRVLRTLVEWNLRGLERRA